MDPLSFWGLPAWARQSWPILGQVRAADVAGHDDDGVFEIDRPALVISQPPIVQQFESQIGGIIDIAMAALVRRLADRDIRAELTEEARAFIARASYSPSYGARPVKRYLQKHVETELAAMLIRGTWTVISFPKNYDICVFRSGDFIFIVKSPLTNVLLRRLRLLQKPLNVQSGCYRRQGRGNRVGLGKMIETCSMGCSGSSAAKM